MVKYNKSLQKNLFKIFLKEYSLLEKGLAIVLYSGHFGLSMEIYKKKKKSKWMNAVTQTGSIVVVLTPQ